MTILIKIATMTLKIRLLLKQIFNKKTEEVAILSIGDSWFNRTAFSPDEYFKTVDTIDWLKQGRTIIDCSIPGNTAFNVLKTKPYKHALPLIKDRSVIVLLSLGGNDVIESFHKFIKGEKSKATVNKKALRQYIKNDIINIINNICIEILTHRYGSTTLLNQKKTDIRFVLHGYDYFHLDKMPSSVFTAMLKDYIDALEIPVERAHKIVRDFLDTVNSEIKKFVDKNYLISYIDLRGKIPKDYWLEQIHPSPEGYKIVADCFANKIREIEKEI